MTTEPTIDVFGYLDYREFLRDYYETKKEHRGLSYRALARRIGLKSASYLKHVIDGDRNLSEEMAFRFGTGLGLKGEALQYFAELVRFNHASSTESRMEAHRRLRGFKKHQKLFPLEAHHADYHSAWYMPAIRELCARPDFDEDPAWIAKRLRPHVAPREISRALTTLLELGLLIRDETGTLRQGEALVSTGAETQSLHIATYHQMMLKMASESIDRFGQTERDISSLTLCIDPDGLEEVKKRMQRFRRELLELSEVAKTPRQVVQINMQLFPLSDGNGDSDNDDGGEES